MRNKKQIANPIADFYHSDILSLSQFTPQALKKIFSVTEKMAEIARNSKPSTILNGKIITLLFYEPSSRTYGSFVAAIKQLGGQTIDILDPKHFSSVAKGETLEDTIRVFEAYSDAIIIRHPEMGAASNAAYAAEQVPVINAGDGIGEHPTQALMDLYTIKEKFGQLDNLTGVIAGDLLHGRTTHSLLRGLSLFKGNTIFVLSPKQLKLNREDFRELRKKGVKLIEIDSERDLPKNAHFWYWTRVQKERFIKPDAYEKVKNSFIITKEMLNKFGNPEMIIMHPLPRVGEIDTSIDADPRAVYLRSQIRNGMYIRMALLSLVLSK